MTDRLDGTAPEPTGLSRRTLAKGAAWAVPAVLIAAPAPALAASLRKDPGINGWVQTRTTPLLGSCRYRLDVTSDVAGTGPDGAPFGLYLYDTLETDVISNAKLIYWIIGQQTASVSSRPGHSSCWTYVGPGTPQPKSDGYTYTPYTFEYDCPIDPSVISTAPDGEPRVWLQDFHVRFEFTQPSAVCNNATFWAQRSIDIDINDGNGPQTLTFERRAGTLGPMSGMRSQSRDAELPEPTEQVSNA